MNENIVSKREIPEELEELRPHPLDDEHIYPNNGGCWICHRGNGWEETDEFEFDMALDTFVHSKCLEKFGVDSISEFEQMIAEFNEDDE